MDGPSHPLSALQYFENAAFKVVFEITDFTYFLHSFDIIMIVVLFV